MQMGSAQSIKDRRQRQPRTRYEEFERVLLADPFRGPTAKEIRHIDEYEPWEFEPPAGTSKPPLLVLAKDNEEWFRCLIEKCDPTVTWRGEDGKKKELGWLLLGNGTRNYAVWSVKVEEWRRNKDREPGLPDAGPQPTSSSLVGPREEWLAEFGEVAVALGISTVAVGPAVAVAVGPAVVFPAAALGPVFWMVIRNWHASFSMGIRSMGLGILTQEELQELQRCFDGCAKVLGKAIVLLGNEIEEIDTNPLNPLCFQAKAKRAESQIRVDTLQSFLEDDVAEVARIARSQASQREQKRVMMEKLRGLFDLCISQGCLYHYNRQMNAPSPEGRHGKTERTDSDDKPILATVQSACLAGKQMNAPSPEQGYGRRGRTVSDDEPIPTPRPSDERLTFQAPGRTERTLVNQFGSSPSLYSTGDDCVRLHVRPGCLGAGQIAGPVTIEMKELCVLVECDGCSFLVSAVADCQPSGATFDVPLNLDFRVGQELDEGDKGAEDRPGLDHYLESLRDTFQILHQEKDNDPWQHIGEDRTEVLYERGMFFIRARIDHFSKWCLVKKIQLENAIYENPVTWPSWAPPTKRQLGFVNATSRPLIFLVLPTSWTHQAILSVATGVAIEGLEVNVAVSKAAAQSILPEATHPQVLQVPCTKREGDPRVGQSFPYRMCNLPKVTGSDARVALITTDSDRVQVWDYQIFQQRTWVWVLPGQFSEGMVPLLGTHVRDDLAPGATCLLNVALMATAKGLEPIRSTAPISTISSMGNGSI